MHSPMHSPTRASPANPPPPPHRPTLSSQEWVEEEQVKNIKTYYKPDNAGGSVPYLPFLVGVVVAMLLTTVVVVSST